MRHLRALPIFAFAVSCFGLNFCIQFKLRAEVTPVNVSFPNETVLSSSQPFGSSVVVADFDGDGRPDVAAASLYDSEISWYRNLGNGTFSTAMVISMVAFGANSIAAADIDADGRLDLLSASVVDDKIAWYRNTGTSPATLFGYNPSSPAANQRIISRNADYAYSVAVADVNGDGLWDVVSASWFDNKIAYYKNLGGGNFGWTAANPTANQRVISTAGISPTCVAAGDLDGDGIFDLAVTSSSDNSLAWFRGGFDGTGQPTFTRYVLSTDLPSAYNVTIADMNKDRVPDLIVAAPAGNKISYFKNATQQPGAAAPFFAPEEVVSLEARGAESVIAADINRDGNLDIVAALLTDNRIIWFPSNGADPNGDVTFGPERLVSGTLGPLSVAAADFDGDGVMDVTSAAQETSLVFINAGEFDGDVTLPPTLIAPANGTVATSLVTVSYTLPEDALPSSVAVNFVSGATVREIIVASNGESAGEHTFSFDPENPRASSSVQTGPESIGDGTYNVTVSYQDAVGNPAATSLPASRLVIDVAAPYLPGASTTILARKGGVVPGAGLNGTGIPANARFRVFGAPSINGAGHLGLTASYSSGSIVRQVILGPGADGETAVLVRAVDFVPNASGTPQSQLVFASFLDVLLNDSDAIAFLGTIRGIGSAVPSVNPRNDRGIWTTAGNGQLRLVAREFDVAEGLSARYSVFTSVALSSNFIRGAETTQRTNIAFVAKLVGTGVIPANDTGLWIYEISSTGEFSTRLLLRKGQDLALPGAAAKRIKALVALPPLSGAAGHGRGSIPSGVAARVEFTDGTQALVRVSGDGVIQEIAMSGDLVPNSGVQLVRFGVPVQNTRGDTLAVASLNSPTNNSALIFAPDEGGHSFAVRKGDTVADIANSIFTSFQIGVVNEEQHVAFIGKVIGRGVNALNDDGLWYLDQALVPPDSGVPLLIAREGRQAAGTPSGAKWASFRSIALPDDAKGPVFLADLAVPLPGRPNPARVTARNNTGLWAVDSSGNLRLLLREGDRYPETNLTVRAISILGNVAGSPAQTRSYNARGDLIYRATLSDGSEVIAKARIP